MYRGFDILITFLGYVLSQISLHVRPYAFHITIFDFYRYNRYQISILHFRVLSFIQLIQFKTNFHFYVMDIEHQIFFLINLKTTPSRKQLLSRVQSSGEMPHSLSYCQYHHTHQKGTGTRKYVDTRGFQSPLLKPTYQANIYKMFQLIAFLIASLRPLLILK